MQNSQHMTELEARLEGDLGVAARKKLQTDLGDLEARLAARVSAGVLKSDFPALAASLKATRAAQLVVSTWTPRRK